MVVITAIATLPALLLVRIEQRGRAPARRGNARASKA
jgi:hypothetical protein